MLFSICSCGESEKHYTRSWLNYDQSVLEIDEDLKEGDLPHYDGETPKKPSDNAYDYEFLGWDKEPEPVSKDAEYIAIYEQIVRKGNITASQESGFYDEPFDLSLTAPRGFDIYYTLDNSLPDENSIKYDSPIRIEDVSYKPNYYSLKQGISSLDVYYPQELIDKCQIIKAIAINNTSQDK